MDEGGPRGLRMISMAEVHDLLFDMLCMLSERCEADGLRYCLISGTLLGAARCGDFIPWDDDADIALPRPDYARLLERMRGSPPGERWRLFGFESGAPFSYARLMDARTRTVHGGFLPGVCVDIFPLDGLPADERRCAAFLRRAEGLRRMHEYCNPTWTAGLREKLLAAPRICRARLRGARCWAERQDRLARSFDFDASEFVGGPCYCMGARERMRREDYFPAAELSLRGRSFRVPGRWDAYLRAMYGDYMTLPPEREWRGHFTRGAFWRE